MILWELERVPSRASRSARAGRSASSSRQKYFGTATWSSPRRRGNVVVVVVIVAVVVVCLRLNPEARWSRAIKYRTSDTHLPTPKRPNISVRVSLCDARSGSMFIVGSWMSIDAVRRPRNAAEIRALKLRMSNTVSRAIVYLAGREKPRVSRTHLHSCRLASRVLTGNSRSSVARSVVRLRAYRIGFCSFLFS